MALPRAKDRAAAAAAEAIASAAYFCVNWFLGRAKYEKETYSSLAAARAARDARGADIYGRRGMIYAVTPANLTVFVE